MNSISSRYPFRLFVVLAGLWSGAQIRASTTAVPLTAEPFEPSQVRLLDGPFKRAMELDAKYLLSLEADRFLSGFRREAGLQPKAEVYGGWEAQGIAGHCLGHYLSACSRMYQDTGQTQFLDRVNYVVDQLAECQGANRNGYVAAIPGGKKIFADLSQGIVQTKDFNLNGGWVPWYTMHKVFAGLIDAYTFCSNSTSLTVATNLANWVDATTKNLTPDQWQTMLICEQGGMNESLANLYAITGNPLYLELARKFYHRAVMDPLAEGRDRLDGLHSNMQIPKTIGVARLYELTGDEKDRAIAEFFWDRVALHRSFAIGGHGDGEHFFPTNAFERHLSMATCETCCTYNMLKLSTHLFAWSPSARIMDFYERALYNDILASQDPETGMFVYLMSLKPGGFKVYSTPENSFWCCVGSGMENHARYADAIYFHNASNLFVNLFIPSELTWGDKGVVLRQETSFPESNSSRLILEKARPSNWALEIRWPEWAGAGFGVEVNGKNQKLSGTPGSYVSIERKWEQGDRVDIHLPMQLRTEFLPGTSNRVAVLYGPIVLAGKLGTNNLPESVYVKNQTQFVRWPTPPTPSFASAPGDAIDRIKPTGRPLEFRTQGLGHPEDVTLEPLYRIHDQRYAVYWDLRSEAEIGAPKSAP